MQYESRLSLTRIICGIILLIIVASCSYLAKVLNDGKWDMIYEARREFANMSDVHVLSETYNEDVVSIDFLTMLLQVEHKGLMKVVINYPGGFDNPQQFWVTQVGTCTTSIELRQRVRYAIDHYDELSERACSATRP